MLEQYKKSQIKLIQNRIMQHILCFVFGFLLTTTKDSHTTALLYPRESETREIKSLDGIWNFVKTNQTTPNEGTLAKWYLNDLSKVFFCFFFQFVYLLQKFCAFSGKLHKTIPMPVPSSYNDITEDLADYVGTVWYDRKFFVSTAWSNNTRVWIRFGSVHYEAQVVSKTQSFSYF